MKFKLLLLFLLTISLYTSSFSQVTFGIKGGATINKLTGMAFKEEFSFGYHIGAFATVSLVKKFSIQPEVLFNQINSDTSSNFSSVYQFNHISNVQLKYLSIPLLLNYNVSNILALQAGPQFGILIDQNKDILKNGGDAFKKGDLSLAGGAQLKLLKFRIYGRYLIGLNDINNISSQDKWKSQSIQFGVGVAL